MTGVKLALGSDEDSELVKELCAWLSEKGAEFSLKIVGANWVTVGKRVAREVAENRCDFGIVMCHTGTGVAMAANKVKGVRAALCKDPYIAQGARRWNDANVLALSLHDLTLESAKAVVEAFLNSKPDPDELSIISSLEADS